MAAPRDQPATWADLQRLPDDIRAEIIRGVIVEKASPSAEHSRLQSAFNVVLGPRFQRRPGGRWPGGWWFATEVEVSYETHEVYRHDIAGWRRDRVPEPPAGRPVRTRPDWVCEVLSPSNARRDRVDKFQTLHLHQVPHYWITDPLEHTLIVHRWARAGYVVVLTAMAGDTVRAEPFDAVELRIATLFGLEDDDELFEARASAPAGACGRARSAAPG